MIARTLLLIVVLLLLVASPAWAVPASVQVKTAYTPASSTPSATFTTNVTTGSCIAVAAWTVDGTATFSSVTSSGGRWLSERDVDGLRYLRQSRCFHRNPGLQGWTLRCPWAVN
jgi:hypothetical protein